MKVVLVGFSKIKYMPYVNFYLENIDRKKNEVHVIYWNRDQKEEDLSHLDGVTVHEFSFYQEDTVPKKKKILGFLRFRSFAKKILKKETFDFAILLHTMPAILLRNTWKRKFKGRFIFDYRDPTYEKYSFFKKWIADLIRASKTTFTSSDGFRVLFPEEVQNKVITTHNLDIVSLEHRNFEKIPSDKIRIAFWGFVRETRLNRIFIERISSDPGFELHFYGREQKVSLELKAFARQLGAKNVFFHGEYRPEERYEFVRNTDLIHNVYEGSNMQIAVANKYYDGIVFRIPLLCQDGSFMGKLAQKSGVGFSMDLSDENCMQKIYDEYHALDSKAFAENCDGELKRVLQEYKTACQTVQSVFQNEE